MQARALAHGLVIAIRYAHMRVTESPSHGDLLRAPALVLVFRKQGELLVGKRQELFVFHRTVGVETADALEASGETLGLRDVRQLVLERQVLLEGALHLVGRLRAAVAAVERQCEVVQVQIRAVR